MLDRILNPTPTLYKWDRFWVGFLPGMLAPPLAILFFYALKMDTMSWAEYIRSLKYLVLLSKVLSFGCVINLAIFFVLMSRDYFNAARGVIGATILYGVPVLLFRFIL